MKVSLFVFERINNCFCGGRHKPTAIRLRKKQYVGRQCVLFYPHALAASGRSAAKFTPRRIGAAPNRAAEPAFRKNFAKQKKRCGDASFSAPQHINMQLNHCGSKEIRRAETRGRYRTDTPEENSKSANQRYSSFLTENTSKAGSLRPS